MRINAASERRRGFLRRVRVIRLKLGNRGMTVADIATEFSCSGSWTGQETSIPSWKLVVSREGRSTNRVFRDFKGHVGVIRSKARSCELDGSGDSEQRRDSTVRITTRTESNSSLMVSKQGRKAISQSGENPSGCTLHARLDPTYETLIYRPPSPMPYTCYLFLQSFRSTKHACSLSSIHPQGLKCAQN